MPRRTLLLTHLLLSALCAFVPLSVQAQTFYGSVTGAVADASGAPLVGVNLTLVNAGTGGRQAVQSSGTGEYRFVNLVPGLYRLDAEKPGFKHLTRDAISVSVEAAV